VVSGSGQPAATFSNARIGTAEGATQTVTAGTLSCHPRGQTAEMGVKKFERHALRRVVALFSPARSDEGAAGCADFAGCIGRVDFDPTTPLFTRPYNRQNRNKSNRGRAAIGDGQQQGTGSNRGRAATGDGKQQAATRTGRGESPCPCESARIDLASRALVD
jgi:hypothetical protein